MNNKALKFLTEVLGTEGAKALARTASKEPSLGKLLVPRAVLSWLDTATTFEGEVPGIANSYLRFQKSENLFSGIVTLADVNYEFREATHEHLAAAVSVAVGIDTASDTSVRDVTLVRLGKSIDALVKAQQLAKSLPKALAADELDKTDAPGPQAGPIEPEEPKDQTAATKPGGGATKLFGQTPPKKKITGLRVKLPALKVEKSEMDRECDVCGGVQFNGNKFRGCICWRDLSKSVRTEVYNDGVVLEFDPGFKLTAFTALRKTLKGT